MEIIIGYALAVVIGFVLGLLGGGGSILTVPVLVYVMGISPELSTSYSLFVVGAASLVGVVRYSAQKQVDYRAAIVFMIPSALAVALAQGFVLPAIPEVLLETTSFTLTKDKGILALFAIIMVLAAYSMIKKRKNKTVDEPVKFNYPMIMLEGAGVGFITGIVGAGGGFLIVPALVLLARIPVKLAIGTSLLVIAGKSLFGFFTTFAGKPIEWPLLLIFTGLAVIGIFAGTWASKFVPASQLKKGFGWFVLVMGTYIIFKELVINT